MEIRKGTKADASFLAEVVTGAIGPELCTGLAGGSDRVPLVKELFTSLAAMPDSQYSYSNAFIAEDSSGRRIGGIIAYDGANLKTLRRAFVMEANRILGWKVTEEEADNWEDEAEPDEIYIDSLYVVPQERKKGVATALLTAVEDKFKNTGKPLGLLVEPENSVAIKTYTNWDFEKKGISNFFRTPMIHMQKYVS